MINKIIVILFISALITFLLIVFPFNKSVSTEAFKLSPKIEVVEEYAPPFFNNEEIELVVKSGFLKIGKAKLSFNGIVNIGGKDLNQVIFGVDTLNVEDIETIYGDPVTYLPVKIERKLNIWGKKMDLLEDYDQENHLVNIHRILKGKKVLQDSFEKDSAIDNALLMVYKYRLKEDLKVGFSEKLNFPTKEVEVKVSKIEEISVPAGKFMAFVIETVPKQFKFWLSADEKRLPVKIDGAVAISSATMLMKSVRSSASDKE